MTGDCIEHGLNHDLYQSLRVDGRYSSVHRVLTAFAHNLPLNGDWIATHTCDNKRCIRVEHLVPGTTSSNALEAVERGQRQTGEKHYNAKLSDADVAAIRADPRVQWQIAEDYGVTQANISLIKRGESRR